MTNSSIIPVFQSVPFEVVFLRMRSLKFAQMGLAGEVRIDVAKGCTAAGMQSSFATSPRPQSNLPVPYSAPGYLAD